MRPTELEKLFKTMRTEAPSRLDHRVYDTIDNATKQTVHSLSLWRKIMRSPITKIAVAAVFIVGCLFLARHLQGGDSAPEPQPNIVKTVEPIPSEEDQPEKTLTNELALAQSLYVQKDLPGLLTLLQTAQEPTQIEIAEFLAEIGDASVLPALQRLADQWQGSIDENPFTATIDAIELRENKEAEGTVGESALTLLQSNPEVSQTTTYQGLVHDESGLSLAVVKVWGHSVSGEMQFRVISEEAVTDQQGRFILKVTPSDYPGHMGVFLYFDHPDYGVWSHQVFSGTGDDQSVTLYPSERVMGTVVDSAGDPVAGAQIEASVQIPNEQEKDRQMLLWAMNEMAVYTDEQGVFVIDRLPQPSRVQLRVHAQGFASFKTGEYVADQSLYAIKAGDREVEITLVPGTAVIGRIVTGDGSLFTEGAVLSIKSVERFVKVDTSGHFVIEGLPTGKHRISISDFKGKELCADATIDIDPLQPIPELVFTVQETVPVTIFVNDSLGGDPAADTKVYACLGDDVSTTVGSGRTNQAGRCQLNLYPGDYQLKTEGWKNGNVYLFKEPLAVSVELPMDDIHITIPTRPMIKGRLIDAEGNPVEGFVRHYVELEPTDPNGFFEMPEPTGTPQRPHFISTYDESRKQGNHFFLRKGDINDEWVVIVELLASLSGRFVDTVGHPVTDVTMSLFARTEGYGQQLPFDPQVDVNGCFAWEDIPYAVPLSLEEGQGLSSLGVNVNIEPLAPGQDYDVGDVILHGVGNLSGTTDWTGSVSGTILDEEGYPKAGIRIETRVDTKTFQDMTNSQGQFSLRGLPKGDWVVIQGQVPGYGHFSETVLPDVNDCNIQIFPQGWGLLGKKAPELCVETWINSDPVSMAQLEGRVVLIQTGVSVTGYSQKLDVMNRLYETYHAQGLEMIAVHHPLHFNWAADITESYVVQFVQDNRIQFRFGLDEKVEAVKHLLKKEHQNCGAMSALYDAKESAALFLIDKTGNVRISPTPENLEAWIKQLLAE